MKSLFVLCVFITLFGFIGCSIEKKSETLEQTQTKTEVFELLKTIDIKDIVITSKNIMVVFQNDPEAGGISVRDMPGNGGWMCGYSYEQFYRIYGKPTVLKAGSKEWVEQVKVYL